MLPSWQHIFLVLQKKSHIPESALIFLKDVQLCFLTETIFNHSAEL